MPTSRWALLTLVFTLAGCARNLTSTSTSTDEASLGPVVLRIDGSSYFSQQVATVSALRSIPPSEAVQHLVDMDYLARLAEKSDLWGPSDIRYQRAVVQRFIDKNFTPRLSQQSIPDDYLRGVYAQRIDEFKRPRQADIEVLAIYTGERMKPEPRQKRAAAAKELFDVLKGSSFNASFQEIASQPKWNARKVMYMRLFQGPDTPLPPAVGNVVLKMNQIGQVTHLIEDLDGYFIARYQGDRPAIDIPFETVRPQLASTSFEHWQKQQFISLSQALLNSHKIELVREK